MRNDSTRRRLRRLAGAGAAVLFLSLLHGADANATNFVPANSTTGCGLNAADDGTHGYYYSSLEANTAAVVDWSRVNNYDPTVINTVNVAYTTATDVAVFDSDYTGTYCGGAWYMETNPGQIGYVNCVRLTGSACDQHEMRFDTDWMLGSEETTTQRRAIACHENGHTLGLAHIANQPTSCMTATPGNAVGLIQHDRDHLNNYAPYNPTTTTTTPPTTTTTRPCTVPNPTGGCLLWA